MSSIKDAMVDIIKQQPEDSSYDEILCDLVQYNNSHYLHRRGTFRWPVLFWRGCGVG